MERFSDRIEDSLCVGQGRPEDSDGRILLFVKMRPGNALTTSLVSEINEVITKNLSSRHLPSFIFQVEDIPVSIVHVLDNLPLTWLI